MVSDADRTKRPARMSVWLGGKAPKGRKADQPSGLDRDRITEVTVRLLDAEGLAKLSMRRLAGELGVTAMSLYWYVDTKDDLLELALDAVFGELDLSRAAEAGDTPEPGGSGVGAGPDWRDELRALAHGYRGLLVAHPWVSPLIGTYLNVGPHSLEFVGRAQHIVRSTGLPARWQGAALGAVFQFVYGLGTVEGHLKKRCADAGMTLEEYYVEAMGATREAAGFEHVMENVDEIVEARGSGTAEELLERDFEVALDLMIAGIETMTARHAEADSDADAESDESGEFAESGEPGEPGASAESGEAA
ncbi:TetR/AcrR family transcriptional regulator [Streptomyces sp. SCSIO 30461]|uniref:TetR/AcrR family transcriptional regulator n=1 Tax=Streptomyces sp. SCSIO 30461 TaxID=3118085 RepID=UPI0030D420C6